MARQGMAKQARQSPMTGRDFELPLIIPAQRRLAHPEDPGLHRMIIAARRAGHRIYRAGPHHALLDGKRVAHSQLRQRLAALPDFAIDAT
jgi:hypothetical protein